MQFKLLTFYDNLRPLRIILSSNRSVPALTYVTLQKKLFVGMCVVNYKGQSYARCGFKLYGIVFWGKIESHSHCLYEVKIKMSDDIHNMSQT